MKRSIMAVAGLTALAACSDLEGPDVEEAPRFSQQEPGHRLRPAVRSRSAGTTVDMAARSWFDIDFGVAGSLKPGMPIQLTVTYTANFATTDADLRVTLPEIEYAKMSDWGHAYKTAVGIQVPAKLESSQGFSAGGQVEQVTVFSIPAAGIYRVHASAISEKHQPDDYDGRAQPATHETVWLLVDEHDGRTLDDFDPAVVPDGFYPQPGPFREVATGEPKPDQAKGVLTHAEGPLRATSCGSDEVCITFVYYDNDLRESWPLRGLDYEWEIVDVPEGSDAESGSGVTDSQGRMVAKCPVYGASGEGTARFVDSKAKIIPRTDHEFTYGHGDCGDELEHTLPSPEGRTWVNAWHSIRNSDALFPTRTRMRIQVNPPESGCGYLPYPDIIRVTQNSIRRCIWGSYGLFVLPHEYGHALHEKKLGGLADIDSSCFEHWPYTWEELGCAYNEGWADYFAFMIQPTVFGDAIPWHSDYTEEKLEDNEYGEENRDGAHFSGMITSFFYDLTDGTSESWDALELDEMDISTVMKNCEVREGSWTSPTGIDHLIWCLEAEVDTDITGGDDYFSGRSPDPTDQNQDDHTWNEDFIRTLWLKNLYLVDG